MTKIDANITNVIAMSKGNVESNTISQSTSGSSMTSQTLANYTGNIFQNALYKTPLNPLLTRGTIGADFSAFTATTVATATINSYEIHKADSDTLRDTFTGINQSNSNSQLSSTAVNRLYPRSTTVADYLNNLETTRGNVLKVYDYATDTGQLLVNETTLINGAISDSANLITLDSTSGLSVGDIIIIDNEKMYITTVSSGTALQVIRGYDNTEVVSHVDNTRVYLETNIDALWVLVYADNANLHHFAKITELLKSDIHGDSIEFSPSLGVDIPKDTKFAIFTSADSAMPQLDSDNQTLVACGYGLLGSTNDGINHRHHNNTHVSRPFFYFLNGKDRLEPATRYILRSSSWDGSSHTYTYSTFLTDQEHEAHIVDYGPFTMEATLVDMMYKADNPSAVNYRSYQDSAVTLVDGTPDKVTVTGQTPFSTNLDGTEGTTWNINGILRDTRFVINASSANDGIYCLDSATDSTPDTLTLDALDFSTGQAASGAIKIITLASSVDLDHNKIYSLIDSTQHFKNSFRMAHRPKLDDTIHGYYMGHTRYLHYCDSPLTNTIIPNALEMIDYESVTSTGGYVDIVFADTQKILAKKIKEGDPLYIHQIVATEEVGKGRTSEIGTVKYEGALSSTIAVNVGANEHKTFLLGSAFPTTSTSTVSRYDPLHDTFTVDVEGTLYHLTPDYVDNKTNDEQAIKIRSYRKDTDTEYTLASSTDMNQKPVPIFESRAFRRKYSFLADNIMTNIPIDTKLTNYVLSNYNGAVASTGNWNKNVRDFDRVIEQLNAGTTTRATVDIGEVNLEKASQSRINDIHLVFKGGQMTGHRIKAEYGDKFNSFLKLKTHLKDERFLENYNRTDVLPYLNGLSNVSLYSYPINLGVDGGGAARYDLARSNTVSNPHVRGILSYLDYFSGAIDFERRVFKGTVESIEQVIEDGMFKLKVRGRNDVAKLLGPIVNKDFKFTEDIVYSTVGPVERMAYLSPIIFPVAGERVYEVGSTTIRIEDITFASGAIQGSTSSMTNSTLQTGDLLYNSSGIFLGRVYDISGTTNATITFEEGIPIRIKDHEPIFVSGSNQLENIPPFSIPNETEIETMDELLSRGNMVSFSKAMSANPYTTNRVNSLLGASDKGVIFTGGNKLSLSTKNAPSLEGSTLVGTSSSSNTLAKGYSIANIGKIDYDLPFYCHFADEITNKNTIDYTNLHTVNSLTEYEIVGLNSKDNDTVIEIAPICPAVLARVDDNPIDGRDKILVTMSGNCRENYAIGYNGPIEFTTWIEELNLGDYIFNSSGELYGKIIDISVGSTGTGTTQAILEGDVISITLDRPLFEAITTSTTLHKYFTSSDSPTYHSGSDMSFGTTQNVDYLSGVSFETSILYAASSGSTAAIAFLRTLKPNMLIKIETTSNMDNAGVFAITHVFEEPNLSAGPVIVFNPRRHEVGSKSDGGDSAFVTDTSVTVRISVLTNYYTQGLYFLNTQGLTQGGTLALTNNYLSSPNASDNRCKPIKYAGGLFHFITDTTITADDSNGSGYNPNASAPVIFSDMIDRYGNTKWRYFGLQKGKYLSYINRRRKDGQIKDTYTTEKGRVNGYATAYRIADAKKGHEDVSAYPYSYHNNDFAWNVVFYDPNIGGISTVSVYDSTNGVRRPSYFLQYLSPESRDFRPVMGSNFADFDKHGTHVSSPDHTEHRCLNYPRFMPRIHDNFRGGDWQEDMDAPINQLDSSIIYKKFSATNEVTDNSVNDFRYKIDTDGSDNWEIEYLATDETKGLPAAISHRWVKLGNHNERIINRTFKLGVSGNTEADIDNLQPPYTRFGGTSIIETVGNLTGDVNSSGFEEITILYPPHIGPKFDGITRAKDHWELPDPKTMRWHIFSPADMYPDSMSRKHHIGYSETIDGTSIERKFTDYNIMLKSQGIFTKSNTLHEFYEGSLEQEIETDDQYSVAPISTASITPSQMKRFGLMRLIDCTYDWHFNLIDPERLPNDMTKLTTPNFEYTRFQPLRRLDARITGYDTNGSVITTNVSDIESHLQVGDQIFTDEGRYIGKVAGRTNASGASTIDLRGSYVKKNILKSDGTKGQYFGYVHVCGDGLVDKDDQDYHDSFYQFMTRGRGGTNTFTEVSSSHRINMLQSFYSASMINSGNQQVPYGTITGTRIASRFKTCNFTNGSANVTINDTSGTAGLQVGMTIAHSGSDVPNGTTISSITNESSFVMSATATGNSTGSGELLEFYTNLVSYNTTSPANVVEIADSSALSVGMGIAGRYIPRDTVITEIDTSGNPHELTISNNVTGTGYGIIYSPIGSGIPINYNNNFDLNLAIRDANITESKFLNHFSRTFSSIGADSYFALPPAFRTFYSDRLEKGVVTTNEFDTHRTINAMASKEDLVMDSNPSGVATNTIATEYTHASNVLEYMQKGGNPYHGCDVVFLDSYSVENSITRPSIGGKIGCGFGGATYQNFAHSKSRNHGLGTSHSDRDGIKYGSGNAPTTDFQDADSGEYSFLNIIPNHEMSGYAAYSSDDSDNATAFFDPEFRSYVAAGVYSAFVPHLCLEAITNELDETTTSLLASSEIADDDVDFDVAQGVVTFDSINGSNSKEGVLKVVTRIPPNGSFFETITVSASATLTNGSNAVTIPARAIRVGMTIKDTTGLSNATVTSITAGTEGVNVTQFTMSVNYTGSTSSSRSLEFHEYNFRWNQFLNFTDLTGMYLVGNIGFSAGDNPTSGVYDPTTNQVYDMLGAQPFDNTSTYAPQYLELVGHKNNTPPKNTIKGKSVVTGNHIAYGSCANMMVLPDHIIYVKEHRRNITGREVAHELLIDNVPHDKTGVARFYNNYRIMRPAEHCLWTASPNEIDMYKLSAQTTKMPKDDSMYGFIPSQSRITQQGQFSGFDNSNSSLFNSGKYGENEAVMSMYVAVDMDARHSQQKQLTQTATIGIGENVVVFNSSVANDIQVGDKLKLGNQKCYVKSISANGLNVSIAGRFASNSALSGATVHLLNNTFTVLRDYIHLFNPSGNRNTFKSGEAYNMLLTDGINKQKISMGVEADYYHDRALCRLSIGKIENNLLGLVSFGEIFTLTTNVPINLENVNKAKIGSTVIIGEEVEDVINNILSSEDVQYDILDNREYPYYIAPNFQGLDLFNASNFAAKFKEKEIRIDETGVSLIKQSNDLDYQDITLSYDNSDLRIISVTRNKSTFDLYNEIIVYGNGRKSIKRNRKSIDKLGKKTLEEVNMELISQDDVDDRAKKLLKAHSEGDDRFTIKMSSAGIEFIKAGDIINLDFPSEGVPADNYKVYEIRRELKGLVELEVGTYRKDLANRFAELSMLNKSNSASIRGSQFTSTTSPLDFFDAIKLKELRLVIKRIGLADANAFTLGFQTLVERKLDFGTTMGPQENTIEIITDEDFV